jgi:ribose transport system substrate-binding protein
VAASAAKVTAAEAPPTFTAPGPAFDASKAKGKKLWVIDVASSIPLTQVTDDAALQALGLVGATLVRFDGKGSVSEFARGVDQAVADKADAIALFAIDPNIVTGPVQKAIAAGIPILVLQYGDANAQLPLNLKAHITYCYSCAGELMADFIVADTKGQQASVDLIVSPEVSNSKPLVTGFTNALTAGCPSCTVRTDNVPIADWQTRIPTTVKSNITSDHSIKYVVPIYDGMSLFAIPAIQTSGRSDVKIVTFNASLGVMQNLDQGKVVSADVGSPQAWEGWALADQFMRVVTGQQPIADEHVGLRMFDATNIKSIDLTKPEKDWYSVQYEPVFRTMWQLP